MKRTKVVKVYDRDNNNFLSVKEYFEGGVILRYEETSRTIFISVLNDKMNRYKDEIKEYLNSKCSCFDEIADDLYIINKFRGEEKTLIDFQRMKKPKSTCLY